MRRIWSKLVGDRGERCAVRYLRRLGFRIIARQYRTSFGEIDVIARDGTDIVFVEVKTRRSEVAGQPFEAVTLAKQRKLTQLAMAYLKQKQLLETPARFDVVSVLWEEGVKTPTIKHYRNAFAPVGSGQMFH